MRASVIASPFCACGADATANPAVTEIKGQDADATDAAETGVEQPSGTASLAPDAPSAPDTLVPDGDRSVAIQPANDTALTRSGPLRQRQGLPTAWVPVRHAGRQVRRMPRRRRLRHGEMVHGNRVQARWQRLHVGSLQDGRGLQGVPLKTCAAGSYLSDGKALYPGNDGGAGKSFVENCGTGETCTSAKCAEPKCTPSESNCSGTVTAKCNDGHPCTQEGCSAGGQCTLTPLPDGTPCGNGKVCKSAMCSG